MGQALKWTRTYGWALIAIAVIGCHRDQGAATAARPRLTPVTLNINPTLGYGPLMIAHDEKFFEDEGIDARFVSLDSNSAIVAAASGKIDVLSVGMRAGIFNMMLKNMPLAIVADRGHSSAQNCVAEGFVAPTAVAKRVAAHGGSPRGERIATVRGGIAEMITSRFLERYHLKNTDVVMIQLPQGASPTSVRPSEDLIQYVVEPNLSGALSEGRTKIIVSGEELMPGHSGSVLIYGKRLLHDDPDLGMRFMRAYLRGVHRYNEGKTDGNIAILSRYTKLPPEVLRRVCWTAIHNDGQIDPQRVQPFLDWALARRYLDGPIPTSKWWNPAFIDAANQRLAAAR